MRRLDTNQSLFTLQYCEKLEKFQMHQLKFIAEDYKRHQDILEQRKKEIIGLKRETENEEKNREAYLASVEKDLERRLQDRQQGTSLLARSLASIDVCDEVNNPNHIELTSIDEYAPYGTAPHSRVSANSRRGRSSRGRGRR